METVIIVIHLMVVLALVATVLLQRSEGGALGIGGGGGGGGGGFMTGRGTANVLTRVTAVLALVFFTTSMVLSLLAGQGGPATSIFDVESPAGTQQEQVPSGGEGGTVLDQLRQQQEPAGPQVPQSQ